MSQKVFSGQQRTYMPLAISGSPKRRRNQSGNINPTFARSLEVPRAGKFWIVLVRDISTCKDAWHAPSMLTFTPKQRQPPLLGKALRSGFLDVEAALTQGHRAHQIGCPQGSVRQKRWES